MNIYKALNEITSYIEKNLENKIDYNVLAKFLGVNRYTMERLFSLITGTTITEYIRLRRLSCAASELCTSPNLKIMDIALKYGYDNATSFSRAFEAFHGVKPSKAKEASLKNYPQITFEEKEYNPVKLDYKIVDMPALTLYGTYQKTDNEHIEQDAPKHFAKIFHKYYQKYGEIDYGMTTYDETREYAKKYYVLYQKPIPKMEKIVIPASKYIMFHIPSQKAKDIHDVTNKFFESFLPSCKFNLKSAPELEYYHDDITDFLVPIEETAKTDN